MHIRQAIPVFLGLMLLAIGTHAQTNPETASRIASQVSVGQIYPSGNVYLKSFRGEEQGSELPGSLVVVSVPAQSSVSLPFAMADRVSAVVKPDYLPGIEGMDEEHPSCSPTARKALVAARYVSRDFFEAMLDFCDENEGIALYRTSTVSYSSLVLAMPAQLRPLNVQVLNGLRPTTERDKEDVSRQKKALELARDCTTTPAYIDSAGRLAEVTLSGGITLALSSYQTPGCAGHLAEIYILDVLQGGNLIHTVFTSRNRGLL